MMSVGSLTRNSLIAVCSLSVGLAACDTPPDEWGMALPDTTEDCSPCCDERNSSDGGEVTEQNEDPIIQCQKPVNNLSSVYTYCSTLVTKAQARKHCKGLDSHLVTITEERENEFIADLIADSSWLGGGDSVEEGYWEWNTGEEWEYSAWGEDEPANSDDIDCTFIAEDSRWSMANCKTEQYSFVCESEVPYMESRMWTCLICENF
jgi:lectin-like protein